MFCDYEKNQNQNQNAFILQNIDSWRVKETDRILAMQQELAKFDFIATWNENSHELAISKKTNSAKNSFASSCDKSANSSSIFAEIITISAPCFFA